MLRIWNRTRLDGTALGDVISNAYVRAGIPQKFETEVIVSWGSWISGTCMPVDKARKIIACVVKLRIPKRRDFGPHQLAMDLWMCAVHEFEHVMDYRKGLIKPLKIGSGYRRPPWRERPQEQRAMFACNAAIYELVMGKDRAARTFIHRLADELVRVGPCWGYR